VNQPLNPENANYVATRAGEQMLVWMYPDGSASYGTVAANGATNFLKGRLADAILFVNNAAQQGWTTQRYDQRWQSACANRTPTGARRRQALITVADLGMRRDEAHPERTVSIYEQNGQYMVMDIESGDPSVNLGGIKEALVELLNAMKPGWVVVRVSPEFSALIEGKLLAAPEEDALPASE
jgi:hypothetical protein